MQKMFVFCRLARLFFLGFRPRVAENQRQVFSVGQAILLVGVCLPEHPSVGPAILLVGILVPEPSLRRDIHFHRRLVSGSPPISRIRTSLEPAPVPASPDQSHENNDFRCLHYCSQGFLRILQTQQHRRPCLWICQSSSSFQQLTRPLLSTEQALEVRFINYCGISTAGCDTIPRSPVSCFENLGPLKTDGVDVRDRCPLNTSLRRGARLPIPTPLSPS